MVHSSPGLMAPLVDNDQPPGAMPMKGVEQPRRQPGWLAPALAAALALAAMAIRLPNLGWGLPEIEEEALPLKKAFQMWGWNEGRLQLDPRTAGWPSLSFYVHLLLLHLIYWGGRLGGFFANRYDFYLLQNDLSPLVVAGRALGVTAVGGVVCIVTRLGARLAGGGAGSVSGGSDRDAVGGSLPLLAGAAAGGALAVSPLLYEQSRLITPDILLLLFAALAVARIVDLRERGRLRDYVWAGIWIGLGASAKYTPVLLAPALYVTHLLRLRSEAADAGAAGAAASATASATTSAAAGAAIARRRLRRLGLTDRRLLWAALACAAAFVLTSPYLLRDQTVFRKDFTSQIMHMSQGHFGQEDRGADALFYMRSALAPALGWPGLLLAAVGLAWAAWRLRGGWVAAALCLACLYLGLGFLGTKFERYMLPVLPTLALGTAGAAVWLGGRLATRPRALRLAAAGLFALLVLASPAWSTWRAARTQARPSTMMLAKRYIMDVLREPGLAFAMEAYTPALPLDNRLEMSAQPVFARLSPEQQRRLLGERHYEVVTIPMYTGMVEMAAFYYDLRHYLPIDVIVTSGAVRGRYERLPDRFPRQRAFYRDLERFTRLERAFAPGPQTSGPEIRIHRFTPEGRERLLRERGPLGPGFHREFRHALHAPHFHAFLEGIARQAYAKQYFSVADLYYQAFYETAPFAQFRPYANALVMAKLQTDQPVAARDLCREVLRREPRDAQAEALLGLALEELGETEGAIAAYERCIALGQEGDAGAGGAAGGEADAPAWARRQLELLRAGTQR